MKTKTKAAAVILSILSFCLVASGAMTNAAIGAVTAKATEELFRANEVQLDLNGFTRSDDLRHFSQGAGVGINYFPWRAAGAGIDTQTESVDSGVIDRLGVALIGRMPIDKLHIAPEFKVGYQYDFERGDSTKVYHDDKGKPHQLRVDADGNEVFASVGGELRFTPHWGVGVEVRGVKPLDHKTSEYVLGIARVRFNW